MRVGRGRVTFAITPDSEDFYDLFIFRIFNLKLTFFRPPHLLLGASLYFSSFANADFRTRELTM